MANLTFGGPDLRTVYIGSLPGMTIPYFRSVVADQPMIHWQRDIWRKRGASELLHSRSFLSEGAFQVAYVVPDIQATQRFFNKTLAGPGFSSSSILPSKSIPIAANQSSVTSTSPSVMQARCRLS